MGGSRRSGFGDFLFFLLFFSSPLSVLFSARFLVVYSAVARVRLRLCARACALLLLSVREGGPRERGLVFGGEGRRAWGSGGVGAGRCA